MGKFVHITCIVFVLFYSSLCKIEHENHGNIDRYEDILHLYNVNETLGLTVNVLEKIIHEFGERFTCESTDDENNFCTDRICLDLINYIEDNVTAISEDQFEDIAIILLHGVLNTTCFTTLNVSRDLVDSYRQALITRLVVDDVTTNLLDVNIIQDTLEQIAVGFVSEDHEGEGQEDDHEGEGQEDDLEGEGREDDRESEGHGHEDEYVVTVAEKCLGADILFDEINPDNQNVLADDIGHVTVSIIYHILKGSRVSRSCRVLPRKEFFLDNLYHIYANDNDTIPLTDFDRILKDLGIGEIHDDEDEEEMHDDEDDHKRKRRDLTQFYNKNWETTCYTSKQLLAIYNIDEDISKPEFLPLCPSLLQQSLSNVCVDAHSPDEQNSKTPSFAAKYGYGSLGMIIVCLCSLFGAVFVKCTSGQAYSIIMSIFLGLAVGTLYTDALLHLLPQALGVHGNEEDDHGHEDSSIIIVEPFLPFALLACTGIYVFYLFQKILSLTHGQHSLTYKGETHTSGFTCNHKLHESSKDVQEKYEVAEKSETDSNKSTLSSLVVMVVLGDAIHNFADGLAVGASFSTSLSVGLSTTIAVFCHELPHELGDFAILLSCGVSFCRALVLNFVSSLTAMVGLYIGLAISTDEVVRQWIVSITAGMFLYIALVNMLPQLLMKTERTKRDFLLNNIGILLGAAIMVLLSLFEEKIVIENL
ncbi:hypothetical protein ACF0H5_012173 [Mactra antiquata]